MEVWSQTNKAKQVQIDVAVGSARSITKVDPSDNGRADLYKPYDTVDKVFGIVDTESQVKYDVLRVRYDPIMGYPKSVLSDRSLTVGDDEFGIKILSLENR
jgi:hypothetical protein